MYFVLKREDGDWGDGSPSKAPATQAFRLKSGPQKPHRARHSGVSVGQRQADFSGSPASLVKTMSHRFSERPYLKK